MSQKNSPKKIGSIKLEPLEEQFFDIKVSKKGKGISPLTSSKGFFRFAYIAFLAFLILSIGNAYVKGKEVISSGKETALLGYENLKGGMDSLLKQDSQGAMDAFTKAEVVFEDFTRNTGYFTVQANAFIQEDLYLDTAHSLLESAKEVANIGQELSSLMEELKALPGIILKGGSLVSPIVLVHEKKEALSSLLAMSAGLQRKLTTLNTGLLPQNLQEQIQLAQGQIGTFIALLLDIDRNFDHVLTLLGDRVPHHYLVLFQNHHERRATGGFIGSYMFMEVNDGKITKMETKDVYETDGQLTAKVPAPPGIDQVADRLYMRDANYSPDFPTAAEQMLWFLEQSGGPSADTVIAIDPALVESLLELTGPIHSDAFPFQISATTFTDLISFHTEAKISGEKTPKKLLFDLIPIFASKLGSLNDLQVLLDLGKRNISQGHLQIYSKDPGLQALSERFKVDGKMITPVKKTDYLSVITTSIGGNKSDKYIKTDLSHQTEVLKNGTLVDKLTIQKTHTWGKDEENRLANMIEKYGTGQLSEEALYHILGRGPNLDYMRVYVPLGSQLQEVKGVSITDVSVTEELGYTVFGFVFGPVEANRDPVTVNIRYQLPYKLSLGSIDHYRFIAENQAGAENIHLKKELKIANNLNIVKSYPTSSQAFSLMPVMQTAFTENQIFIAALSAH